MPRGRYAPTPSGNLHIGNISTALLAWLQIRQVDGEFILRMEDIDRPRCRPEYAERIIEDLRWIGIDWDEGPDIGGPFQPYTQSERLAYYEDALQVLADRNLVYPCYCSRAQLMSLASAPHGLASEGPIYPGTCRELTEEERMEKAHTKFPSIRFQISDKPVSYQDGLLGHQCFPREFGGDFVVKRADRLFAYQLAVVIDDAMMGITHIVRGADLLDSTPRQIQLYEALQYTIPSFTHVPLLYMGTDVKLSKRHSKGSASVANIRKAGWNAEMLIGWIAYMYGQISSPEPLTARELLTLFNLADVPTSPIIIPEQMLKKLYA